MRLAFVAALVTLVACGAREQQLRTRAAFDMQCPEEQLRVTELDQRTRGVEGCGRRGTYVDSCEQPTQVSGCTWILNADAQPTQKASPAP